MAGINGDSGSDLRSWLRLLAILDDATVAADETVDLALQAIDGGATALQLRFKQTPAARVVAIATAIREHSGVPLFVNDRVDVALAAGAVGVHLGADDIPAEGAKLIAEGRLLVGASVGSESESRVAAEAGADYWGTGPCFMTASKREAGTPLGVDGFRRIRALAPDGVPVVAIGGVTHTNCSSLIQAGAAGVAVIHAIFGAPDVRGATQRLRAELDSAMA